jgi:hypothetical protein
VENDRIGKVCGEFRWLCFTAAAVSESALVEHLQKFGGEAEARTYSS